MQVRARFFYPPLVVSRFLLTTTPAATGQKLPDLRQPFPFALAELVGRLGEYFIHPSLDFDLTLLICCQLHRGNPNDGQTTL